MVCQLSAPERYFAWNARGSLADRVGLGIDVPDELHCGYVKHAVVESRCMSSVPVALQGLGGERSVSMPSRAVDAVGLQCSLGHDHVTLPSYVTCHALCFCMISVSRILESDYLVLGLYFLQRIIHQVFFES